LKEVADSGLEDQVNEAVRVLLASGLSTPTLCMTVARTGPLRLAGYIYWSSLVFAVGGWFYIGLTILAANFDASVYSAWKCDDEEVPWRHACSEGQFAGYACGELCSDWCEQSLYACSPILERPQVWVAFVILLEVVVFVICFIFMEQDRRSFATKALGRLAVPLNFVIMLLFEGFFHDVLSRCLKYFCVAATMLLLAMLLALVGPARASKLPGIGPWLVYVVMGMASCPACNARSAESVDRVPI
jgi:hypothetical protein